MDMKKLAEMAAKDLPERLSERVPGVLAENKWIEKTHGRSYYGIVVQKPDTDYGLCINPADLMEGMEGEFDYGRFMEELQRNVETLIHVRPSTADIDIEDYESVRSHLFPELVSAKRDRELLSMLPHILVDDLAIVFRIVMGDENVGGPVSAMITNELLSLYGRTAEELYEDACSSAPLLFPPILKTMEQILFDMTGNTAFAGSAPIYVATCNGGYFGAGVVFYPGFLDSVSEKLDTDLLLLPSSVHEMIILPYDPSLDVDNLIRIVKEVNSRDVQPGDQLTDSVYFYNRRTGYFGRVLTAEERQSAGGTYCCPVRPS